MNNASGTFFRRASELDVGSRVVVGGTIRTVVRVIDIRNDFGTSISIWWEGGGATIERPSAMYTCVSAE